MRCRDLCNSQSGAGTECKQKAEDESASGEPGSCEMQARERREAYHLSADSSKRQQKSLWYDSSVRVGMRELSCPSSYMLCGFVFLVFLFSGNSAKE